MDWKWILTSAVVGFNACAFLIIKFNDLCHLEKGVNEIKDCVKELSHKIDNLTERVSKIEGKLEA